MLAPGWALRVLLGFGWALPNDLQNANERTKAGE
jgi:hypothetical protein